MSGAGDMKMNETDPYSQEFTTREENVRLKQTNSKKQNLASQSY